MQMADVLCETCGNPRKTGNTVCPFCGARDIVVEDSSGKRRRNHSHRTVNLEIGRPGLELALRKLDEVLEDGIRNGVDVITLIHGYGSTGKGGVIRQECRKSLDYLRSKGEIRDYIPGEEFNSRSGRVRDLLRRFPGLKHDKNLDRGNRGLTLVIL